MRSLSAPSVERALAIARKRLGGPPVEARLDAQWLLSHVTGRDRAWLIAHADATLGPADAERYDELVARRAAGEPVAYITGSAGFYGHEFAVTSDVLVPRPDSELMVEAAVADLRARLGRASRVRLCDIGTGSGALGLACALAVDAADVVLTDASPAALAVAERNARALGVRSRCVLREGDLFAAAADDGPYDVVLANLPYIPTSGIPARPSPVAFEPPLALDGGADGLDLYRRLLPQLAAGVATGALRAGTAGPAGATTCFFEAGYDTIERLADLAEATFPEAFVEIGDDYAGLERYVVVTL